MQATPTTTTTPEELLDAVARGDRMALQALYGRFGPKLWSIALRVLKDPREAEDVLQETFVDVWRTATRYDPNRAAVERWLTTMVRTRAIDRLRKRSVREHAVEGLTHEPFARVVTPEQELEHARDASRLRDALATLPEEQRRALELAYFEGLSQTEIAERTDTPLGTVKTRMRLALQKLSTTIDAR
ncbi:MAG: sigma-70 family RNA polymerase sigma factor [Myxococcaceae bacterium]|nr:sigma-70 family RNA polymerase sigma factor [Myxococcaceae bacterium]